MLKNDDALEVEEYDLIIVGAGSAGSVLANRLSADPSLRVLLLEEGGIDDSWLLSMPKGFGLALRQSKYVFSYKVSRQDIAGSEIWLRGKTLGGSSSVNGMVWTRGQPEDYDHFAELGLDGWDWAQIDPCFRQVERRNVATKSVKDGIHVRIHPEPNRLGDAMIAAALTLGLPERNYLDDMCREGAGYLALSIDARGRRSSAARAFLKPVLARHNLTLSTHTKVEKIIFDRRRAVGLQTSRDGQRLLFRARQEIILCAGAIASPAILQRSGIGDASLLRDLGIPVIVDRPAVGRNMREHFLLDLQFRLKHWSDSENRSYSGLRLFFNVLRYAAGLGGPMSYGPYQTVAFASSVPEISRPDMQIMLARWSRNEQRAFHDVPGMGMFGYLLRPESHGELRITSRDPDAPLHIEPNYLSTQRDRDACVAMFRYIRRLAAQAPLAALIEAEMQPSAGVHTDDDIIGLFRTRGRPGMHACGTCAMGEVTDSRLRVCGVDGLRVMDCSVYPTMPSCNLNAPTMAMAWRAADFILHERASDQKPAPSSEPVDIRSAHQDALG